MAITVKHPFVSAKADDPDATNVRPSNWNENHTLTMATNRLLGRGTAAAGAVEEITLGTNLALSGTTLNATGASVSAASRLLGRGSASGAGVQEEITLGTNLSMSGTTLNATVSGVVAFSSPQGRLTLQTGVPVMTATQSAKTAIFYTPYVGNQIPIYDGSAFAPAAFTELTVATTDTTKSPAAIGASKVNDWFVWSDAGTLRLGHGPDWTSDSVRSAGTALVRVNGILLNNATITNGPAASRGTYVGTTRSNASSQLDWIYGVPGAPATPGFFGVWNAYNSIQFASMLRDTTASWTYNLSTWRNSNTSAANRFSFVNGLAQDATIAQFLIHGLAQTSFDMMIGIGIDGADPVDACYVNALSMLTPMIIQHCMMHPEGFHSLQCMEKIPANGGPSNTFYANAFASPTMKYTLAFFA